MPGVAEAIVMGSKLYKAGKTVVGSAKSVNRGMQNFNKKQETIQKHKIVEQNKQQRLAQKNAPKAPAKPKAAPAPNQPKVSKPFAPAKKPKKK